VNRGPYDGRPLGTERLQRIRSVERPGAVRLVLVEATSRAGARFAAETLEATRVINEDREMSETSERWLRQTWRDIQEHCDGLTLAALGMPPALRTVAMMLPGVSAKTFKGGWLRSTEEGLATSPLYGLIVVRDLDDRVGQLEAGRLWQRLHLEATRLGLAAQPLNQWMERVDRERQLCGTAPSRDGRGHRISGGSGHLCFPPGLRGPRGAAKSPAAGGSSGPSGHLIRLGREAGECTGRSGSARKIRGCDLSVP
jgi:hypothetical protein